MSFSWEFILSTFLIMWMIKSSTAKFYLKFIVTYSFVIGISVVFLPFFILRAKNVENLTATAGFMTITSRIVGLKYTIRGKEHMSKDEACVLVVNHQSSVDVLGMFELWRVLKRATVVAKRELLLLSGPFGIAMYFAGLTFINRKSGAKAGQTMNDAVKMLKKDNIKLMIYPEGTRRNTGEIHPFKKGAFHAAIYAQVPIVPVVFSCYQSFLNVEKRIFNSGKIIIEGLPEISTVGLSLDDVDELMEKTRNAMIKKYDELKCEFET